MFNKQIHIPHNIVEQIYEVLAKRKVKTDIIVDPSTLRDRLFSALNRAINDKDLEFKCRQVLSELGFIVPFVFDK